MCVCVCMFDCSSMFVLSVGLLVQRQTQRTCCEHNSLWVFSLVYDIMVSRLVCPSLLCQTHRRHNIKSHESTHAHTHTNQHAFTTYKHIEFPKHPHITTYTHTKVYIDFHQASCLPYRSRVHKIYIYISVVVIATYIKRYSALSIYIMSATHKPFRAIFDLMCFFVWILFHMHRYSHAWKREVNFYSTHMGLCVINV